MKKVKKCRIFGCPNTSDKGAFTKNLCSPCYDYIHSGKGHTNQAYMNDEKLRNMKKEKENLLIFLDKIKEVINKKMIRIWRNL